MIRFFCWIDPSCSDISELCCQTWASRLLFIHLLSLIHNVTDSTLILEKNQAFSSLGRLTNSIWAEGPGFVPDPVRWWAEQQLQLTHSNVSSEGQLETWGIKELECPGSHDCFSFNSPGGRKYEAAWRSARLDLKVLSKSVWQVPSRPWLCCQVVHNYVTRSCIIEAWPWLKTAPSKTTSDQSAKAGWGPAEMASP